MMRWRLSDQQEMTQERYPRNTSPGKLGHDCVSVAPNHRHQAEIYRGHKYMRRLKADPETNCWIALLSLTYRSTTKSRTDHHTGLCQLSVNTIGQLSPSTRPLAVSRLCKGVRSIFVRGPLQNILVYDPRSKSPTPHQPRVIMQIPQD